MSEDKNKTTAPVESAENNIEASSPVQKMEKKVKEKKKKKHKKQIQPKDAGNISLFYSF